MTKAGKYDVYKANGELVGKINLIEDSCEKLLNIKIYHMFELKEREYYIKRAKIQ